MNFLRICGFGDKKCIVEKNANATITVEKNINKGRQGYVLLRSGGLALSSKKKMSSRSNVHITFYNKVSFYDLSMLRLKSM